MELICKADSFYPQPYKKDIKIQEQDNSNIRDEADTSQCQPVENGWIKYWLISLLYTHNI